jgi:DNA (cytosine-5)-methyltransferase 1
VITFGSLFAGIGGFDLGLERALMRCAWQVEIDDKARSVLERHWPDVNRSVCDVTKAGRHNLRPVDLICGGFPCQGVSVAGRREGLADKRSGLWFEFHRILGELAPRWVIVENVPGLLSSNGGRDFAVILRGLVELGYGVCWRILDAQYFGVAQRRRRVFIVGSLGTGRAAEVLFEREGSAWHPAPSREAGARTAVPLTESFAKHHGASAGKDSYPHNLIAMQCHGSNVGPMGTLRRGNGDITGGVPFVAVQHSIIGRKPEAGAQGKGWRDDGATWTLDSRGEPDVVAFDCYNLAPTGDKMGIIREQHGTNANVVFSAFVVRRLTSTECERLQGFPDGWTAGQSDSARYRQLGNAVEVDCAEWIGQRIIAVEEAG